MFDVGTTITLLMAGIGAVIWASLPDKKLKFQVKSPIILAMLVVYIIKGISLLISDAPIGIATIALLTKIGVTSANTAGALYLSAALSAVLGTFMTMPVGIFFFIPQMALSVAASYSALSAVFCGCYVDGVIRSPLFILADQAPAIVLGVAYTSVIIVDYVKSIKKLHEAKIVAEEVAIELALKMSKKEGE